MKFIIATHNNKKLVEMQRILEPLGVSVVTDKMVGLSLSDVEETGSTFEENAVLKSESGCRESGMPCIADDSGLVVDALGGEPGVYSARYAGEHGDDEANIIKLLNNLSNTPDEERTARFMCCISVSFPDGGRLTVDGCCEGKIGYEKIGDNGFGYDPVFMVGDKSFAQLTDSQKDEISHRGNALKKLRKELEQFIDFKGDRV